MDKIDVLDHTLHFFFCTLIGLVVGVPMAMVGAHTFTNISLYGSILGAVIGMLGGYPVGVFVGVVLFAKLQKKEGSMLWALIATILATILFVAVFEIFKWKPILLWTYFFLSFPIITIIGYHKGFKVK